ncbi:WD40-repeat-containing domain protein [Mucor mucedo]|uniref:WD40-repeat-containing domain protein n=1 Tax=Mucor mucedo TaxID=29922 RepID=UPI00221FF39E|nr:WD40-repeat-containing domain protein [Mucor mucedo]KAI7881508.1 WD40-repeat-containing domain protein [Mucor mucedo]
MKPTEIRAIDTRPFKTLDAPDLKDDFYMNLLDWGTNDCLAVGLGTSVFLWNANNSRVYRLCDLVIDKVTSVKWSSVGSLLSVGSNSGKVHLYDTQRLRRVRTWNNHTMRVGAISWKSNILSTGGRDHTIFHQDVRSQNPHFNRMQQHSHEVCGLQWNNEGTMLASGGNDNQLLLWDSHSNSIVHRLNQHTAAVKALSWSPHKRGVLVSGGGTNDKTIKFWDTISGKLTSSYPVGSQVCNLKWSKKTDEIVSTHGLTDELNSSGSQIIIWKPYKLKKVATLSGHDNRVTYMTMSHDGDIVVTGGSDETIKFWDVFSSAKQVEIQKDR